MAGAAALGALAAVVLLGCSPNRVFAPNLAPHTTLFVQFPDDSVDHSVHHEVHLYWFGTDEDGTVVGYDVRFLTPGGPADPPWQRTTRLDSLFVMPAGADTVEYVFEVRAVDDAGAADPTPARQDLRLRNQPPTVTLIAPPGSRDTTFASITLVWRGVDPDGDANDMTYRVWLDGNEAGARTVTGGGVTLPSEDFLIGGRYSSRPRTIHVQAFDSGLRPSSVVTATWFVRSPAPDSTLLRGRLLLVDDMRNSQPGGPQVDNLYANATVQNVPPRTFSVLRLEVNQPFRSAADLLQTLRLFDVVVWYRGTERVVSASDGAVLRSYHGAIGEYLEGGGRFYLEALDMVTGTNAEGLLPQAFMRAHLGSDFLYRRVQPPADSSANWGIQASYTDTIEGRPRNHPAILRSTVYADSLRQAAILAGLRGFGVRDTNDVALWARDSVLSERPTFDVPIGVTVAQPQGGRMVAISTAVIAANGPFPPQPGNALRFLSKIFRHLGLGPS